MLELQRDGVELLDVFLMDTFKTVIGLVSFKTHGRSFLDIETRRGAPRGIGIELKRVKNITGRGKSPIP
jgi:hypothetical protein